MIYSRNQRALGCSILNAVKVLLPAQRSVNCTSTSLRGLASNCLAVRVSYRGEGERGGALGLTTPPNRDAKV